MPAHYSISLKHDVTAVLVLYISNTPNWCKIRGTKQTISFCERKTCASESFLIPNPVPL